jgi:NOL1/NOP2/fmu family ribosome biogenesis protein
MDPARRLDLSLGDPRLADYLGGHPIDASGQAGWVVVTVQGFPLGWGKRVGSVVKNHYPKGLRRDARGG